MNPEARQEDRRQRFQILENLLDKRILIVDGAMGTSIQNLNLSSSDFGGEQFDGCNEYLNHWNPEAIAGIHRSFLEAGADIIETNTFGSTPLVLDEYGIGEQARELSRTAAEIARRTAAQLSTKENPRFVAGSMGPTTKSLSVTGGVTFDALSASYREQALGLIEGGVDFLIVETSQDTLNIKAAVRGINAAMGELGDSISLVVSGTIEPMGAMLAGQGVEAMYTSLEHLDLLAVGLNCATGPGFMTDHLRSLSAIAACRISCVPNAGLPDADGRYNLSPEAMAKTLSTFADEGWLNLAGGCCGTTPAYTAALSKALLEKSPRGGNVERKSRVSGIEFLSLEEENRPIIVGERTNVIGSRKFKRLIHEDKFEEASEIGRRQVRGGAHIIDICLADTDRDEKSDVTRFLDYVTRKVKVPLMLDSTDPEVLLESLKRCQGKSIINSINLEDGELRFESVVPLAREFGAALVVGCIDDDKNQGMAITRERKLEVATRSHELLTLKYGVAQEDIIFDPLVFPCATGDANYRGSAIETIEGMRLIKDHFPKCKTLLGISNVSFGLPPAGREVLNSVFLHLNVTAGLDLAIVNSEKLMRYASIPDAERALCEDLIYDRGPDSIGAFAAFYRDQRPTRIASHVADRPLESRLADYIIEGSKDGLIEDLEQALGDRTPLEIINGPLMAGMDEVGRLFNKNELIVAEVLQSAEAMKAAVAHLEPLMEKEDASGRGTILLATVKGDVHDIGKNLVEIILGNNGYRIVNLGIKVPPQDLIQAVQEHGPDIVGLSGLLVKSAQQMVSTAHDMSAAGLDVPILVGGAALTQKFTQGRIAPEYDGPVLYARDAMDGLELANRLVNPKNRDAVIRERGGRSTPERRTIVAPPVAEEQPEWEAVSIPPPPDFERHSVTAVTLPEVFEYVNPAMLYGKHLGLKGSFEKLVKAGDSKALKLKECVDQVKQNVLRHGWMTPKGVFQFYHAWSHGNAVVVANPKGKERVRFQFPRQSYGERLCLADWIAPKDKTHDYLAMFVATCGGGVREAAERWKAEGEYLKSHVLQALAIESAEALAELLHSRIRSLWGIPDAPDLSRRDVFQARYRGLRASFGYPACPNLEDQALLWTLLDPERTVGVSLTDGYMMDPEASVSALVFHHPAAKYFSVRGTPIQV